MKKRRDLVLWVVGLACLISGVCIFLAYFWFNNYLNDKVAENLSKNTIYVDTKTGELNNTSNDNTLGAIESLNSNQKVKKVAKFTNVLSIPRLKIKTYINEGVDSYALSSGVGHHTTTAKLGAKGNCVIAGHSSVIYDCIFNRLDKIQLGEAFYIYDARGRKHKYYVCDKFICEPDNTDILKNIDKSISKVTIYTCANKGTQRLVIIGKEFNKVQLSNFLLTLDEQYLSKMLSINEGIKVETLSEALNARSSQKLEVYDFSKINVKKKGAFINDFSKN